MVMKVDVWSDVACPWCWVGKRRLEHAITSFGEAVEVRWRAFELDPSAPPSRDTAVDYLDRLARKYGTTRSQAQAMVDRMTAAGAADGLDFRFDRIRSGNTFDAHRLLHWAHERGLQNELKERFMVGYFSEGEPIGERPALEKMAVEIGLDAAEVHHLLDTNACAEAVRADEAEARRLGITGVPFFVLGERVAFSGAQPTDVIVQVLERVAAESAPSVVEGAACTPSGCD